MRQRCGAGYRLGTRQGFQHLGNCTYALLCVVSFNISSFLISCGNEKARRSFDHALSPSHSVSAFRYTAS